MGPFLGEGSSRWCLRLVIDWQGPFKDGWLLYKDQRLGVLAMLQLGNRSNQDMLGNVLIRSIGIMSAVAAHGAHLLLRSFSRGCLSLSEFLCCSL